MANLEELLKKRSNLSVKKSDWKKKGKDISPIEEELNEISRQIKELREGSIMTTSSNKVATATFTKVKTESSIVLEKTLSELAELKKELTEVKAAKASLEKELDEIKKKYSNAISANKPSTPTVDTSHMPEFKKEWSYSESIYIYSYRFVDDFDSIEMQEKVSINLGSGAKIYVSEPFRRIKRWAKGSVHPLRIERIGREPYLIVVYTDGTKVKFRHCDSLR